MFWPRKNSDTKFFMGAFPWKVTPEFLAFLLSIYFSLFLNDILWSDLLKTQTGTATARWAFFWAVYVAVTSLQFLVINVLLWGRYSKWLAILLLVATVMADYFAETYGVHFDTTMLRNIFTTNPAEARELLTGSLLIHFLQYASIPVLAIYFLKIKENSFFRTITKKLLITSILLAVSLGALMSQMKNFSSTMRNHKEISHVFLAMTFLSQIKFFIIYASFNIKHSQNSME